MSHPISVIIPVYNGERFLREALTSVAEQTVGVAEIVVVDDGSTDGSAAIAESFPGVTLIRQDNRGVSAARNSGLVAISGSLVAFLDADDVWLPAKLGRQIETLDEGVGLVTTLHRHLVEPGVDVPPWMQRVIARDGESGGIPSTWLVRREAFQQVGLFDEAMRFGEDLDWLARASDAGVTVVSLNEQLVFRRVHGSNLTLQHAAEARGRLLTILRTTVRRKRDARGASAGPPGSRLP